MISNAKPVFALPDMANHVIDTGNNLILGGKYYNKDLSPALVSEAWSPLETNPLSMFQNGTTNTYANMERDYVGYGSWASPFYIRGNSSFAWYDRAPSAIKYGGPSCYQTRMADVWSPYFDSTMGSTAGKRLVILPRMHIYQVMGNGSLSLLSSNTAYDYSTTLVYASDMSMIVGESAAYLYILRVLCVSNADYQSKVLRMSKVDYSITLMSAANAGDQRTIRFMGTSTDNKLIFAYVPQAPNTASYQNLAYLMVDMTAGSGSPTTTPYAVSGSPTTIAGVGIGISSLVPDIQDINSNHFYWPNVGSAVSTDTTITRVKLPKTIGAKVNPVAGDCTLCTLTGIPAGQTLLNPALAPVSGTAVSQITLLTKYDGSNEYLIVINHGYEMGVVQSGNSYTDNCGTTRFAFFVFLVDPTNSANLIYKQSLYINDIGGQVPYMVNAAIDRTVIALAGVTQVVPLKWNASSETYTVGKIISLPAQVQRLGIDDQNQILVEDGANKLYVFQLDNSIDVSIAYAGNVTSLNYTGTPLSVDVLINTYDMNNNRVAKTVALNVQNAVFTATSTTNATVTTSASADTVVNITINAGGQVVVTPISVT